MRVRFVVGLAILVGITWLGLFAFFSGSVAPDGRLQQPFALLPLSRERAA
ncbi:TPA: DUF3955 domain-containing protein [Pseudomonas aeruginosa]|nr:DUF3955 domain-containing protein [Pseudomonas aeruginosa]